MYELCIDLFSFYLFSHGCLLQGHSVTQETDIIMTQIPWLAVSGSLAVDGIL